MNVTKDSLYIGIEKMQVNNRVGDIGSAIQNYINQYGYGIVRELVGHGLGKNLHEEPEIPNYGKSGTGKILKDGFCFLFNLLTKKF